MNPSPIASDIASTTQLAVLKSRSSRFMYARRLGRIVLVVVDRTRQPMRHGDDGLIDPRPVLFAALAKPLLRTRSDHSLIPGLQFGNVVLETTHGSRNDEQKNSRGRRPCWRRPPTAAPQQIGKYRDRENLDRRRQRKHAPRHPWALMLQQPEPEQHHRQQNEVGLPEIEHVENKGDGDEARQRKQPRPGLSAPSPSSRSRIGPSSTTRPR